MNDTEINLPDVATVEKAMADPEVSKLPLGSKEFNAAVEKLSTKTTVDDTDGSTTAGDADNEDDASEEDVEKEEEQSPNPRSKSARIKQLRQEKADLERRLAERETYREEPQQEREVKASLTRERPQRDDPQFAEYDDYVEALTEWKSEQIDAQRQYNASQRALKAHDAERVKLYEERAKAYKAEVRDYDDVVYGETVLALKPSDAVREYLRTETDNAPQILYKLIKDEELAEKFAEASPVQQVKILSRLDLSFESPSTTAKKTVTSMGDPPPRLPTGRTSTVSGADLIKDADKISFADWDKHFQKKTANFRR